MFADEYVMRAEHDALLRDAKTERLRREATASRPRFRERVYLSVADLFAIFGLWLRAPHYPPPSGQQEHPSARLRGHTMNGQL